ncbi:MAG: hypothetical protein ACI86H_001101 [bacterium]|jgi:hypothetical protein
MKNNRKVIFLSVKLRSRNVNKKAWLPKTTTVEIVTPHKPEVLTALAK